MRLRNLFYCILFFGVSCMEHPKPWTIQFNELQAQAMPSQAEMLRSVHQLDPSTVNKRYTLSDLEALYKKLNAKPKPKPTQPITPPSAPVPDPIFVANPVGSLNLCRGVYALMADKFNYPAYRASMNGVRQYSIAVLWNTFGKKFTNLTSELDSPRVVGIEAALFNTTCLHGAGHPCGKYEVVYGYDKNSLNKAIATDDQNLKAKMVASSNEAAGVILGHLRPGVKCWISPFLEGEVSSTNFAKVVTWISPSFQGKCDFVWNPVGAKPGSPAAGAVVSEGHGDSPAFPGGVRCIANNDGTPISGSEITGFLSRYGANCEAACAWALADNCHAKGQPWLDPRSRPCKDTGDFAAMGSALRNVQDYKPAPAWSAEDDKSLIGCTVLPNPDGAKKGFLAKPSEVAVYGWTLLLPAQFDSAKRPINYKDVHAEKAGARVGQFLKNSRGEFYLPDGSKRPLWRATQKPDKFPTNLAIRAIDKKGRAVCWKVHDPRQRND